jgi:hypothetical protein
MAPSTAQSASGSRHGRKITPAIATAAMINVAAWAGVSCIAQVICGVEHSPDVYPTQ